MEFNWFVLALLDAFFAALVAIFAKIGLQNVDSTLATTIRTFVMMAFMLSVTIFTGKLDSISTLTRKEGMYILLSGVAGAVSWLFYFASLKIGEASKVSAVDRSSLLFVVILSILVLSEKVTVKTVLSTILIFAGLLLFAL